MIDLLRGLIRVGLFKILLFNDSRKVGLGGWIYFTTTPMFCFSLFWNAAHPPVIGSPPVGISFEQYLFFIGVSTTLIGGGTLADRWLDKKKPSDQPPAPTP